MMSATSLLLLTLPALPSLWSGFDEAACHRRRYTADGFAHTLRDAGLRVEYLSPFMAALYPLMWAKRRLMQRLRSATPCDAVLDDLRIVPILNGAMIFLLSREVSVIRARRRLPFGTSLVAIARRTRSLA